MLDVLDGLRGRNSRVYLELLLCVDSRHPSIPAARLACRNSKEGESVDLIVNERTINISLYPSIHQDSYSYTQYGVAGWIASASVEP